MLSNIIIVLLSFLASLGFSIVFQMERRHLLFAGLGGAVTRIVYLTLLAVTGQRAVYMVFAAIAAAVYAEFMADRMHTPSTTFLYPSIIPLIPGDLVYNAIVGLVLMDWEQLRINGVALIIALFWMCVGFVLTSTITHYVRRNRMVRKFMHKIR